MTTLDLDEYTEAELNNELMRRRAMRNKGVCDYCGRSSETSPCKFPDRHQSSQLLDVPEFLRSKP